VKRSLYDSNNQVKKGSEESTIPCLGGGTHSEIHVRAYPVYTTTGNININVTFVSVICNVILHIKEIYTHDKGTSCAMISTDLMYFFISSLRNVCRVSIPFDPLKCNNPPM